MKNGMTFQNLQGKMEGQNNTKELGEKTMSLKRKLIGVTMSAVMICSMFGATVFAASGGSTIPPYITDAGNLTIEKVLEVTGSGDMAPHETFTFKIEPFDLGVGTTVDSLVVKKGKDLKNATNISTKEFSNQDKATEQEGKKVVIDKTAVFDFSTVGFEANSPAIYRYKVTENAGNNTGIVTYDKTAYQLDVYVDNQGKPTALVAKKLNENQDAIVEEKVPVRFENAYDTEDLTITKEVTGSSGETKKEFHFEITINESNCLTGGTILVGKKHTQESHSEDVNIKVGEKTEFALKDGESLVLMNLPKETKYILTEKEANANGYITTVNPKITTKDDDNGNFTVKDGSNAVTFINDRDTITPTGILLNVAPYAAAVILAAFAAIFLLAKKKRSRQV